jgi:beta-glucosidase
MSTDHAPLDIPALLAALTLEEKVSLLDGHDFWRTEPIERLGIPKVMVADGPHGLRKQPEGGDHLGLRGSVPATCFPPAAGLASTWDVDLVEQVGVALGRECRAHGVAVLLGPGVNMKRSPLCGRNFEYFSEDPALAGALAVAMVRGVQSQGVGTSVKHYAANNQETERMTVSAEVDERTLREIYLPAFEQAVVESAPWTLMSSYNRINGVYASESHWLLTQVLRDDWGFDGLVMSDWGGTARRDVGLVAGLDLEMPSSSGSGARILLDALEAGTILEADVDRAAARVLQLVDRGIRGAAGEVTVDADEHHALARAAAAASIVLLKNDTGLLPLARSGGAVAVIGEFARTPRFQGAGSSQVNPTRLDSALDALIETLGVSREVRFAAGYEIENEESDPALIADAVAAATAADVVVLFLGLPPLYESEGYDRTHIDLPAPQVALLHAVADANPNVVVVLSNGSVVSVVPWQHRAPSVLEGWLLGQAGGSAIADVLLGDVSPSGRLAETMPVRLEDTPTIGNWPGEHGVVRYGEGLLIGYRWYDTRAVDVAYPFGHGLSYTTFDYADLALEVLTDGDDPQVRVTLTVTNSGQRDGIETVQVYVSDPQCSVFRPAQELRAFTRVALAAGESRTVTLDLGMRAFAYWHQTAQRWAVEGGVFEVRVGASSRDIRLTGSVTMTGHDIVPELTVESSAEAWLAHPVAGPWLRDALSGHGFGVVMFDKTNGEMMRAIPMCRLSRLPGFPVSEDQARQALRDLAATTTEETS